MISQRLDSKTWELFQELQDDLYSYFYKQLLTQDTIECIANFCRNYFLNLRAYGHYVPHFTFYVGVCPFDPSRIEIYDQQNFDYVFPKERVPKMVVRVSL